MSSGVSPDRKAGSRRRNKMDQETRQRLEAVEARLVVLENRPVATLEVAETKPKRVTNRKPLTDEQKLEHVARLRKGKLAAKARREAEAEAQAVATPEARAEADAKAHMAEAELPKDATGVSNLWDTLTIPQRTKIAKEAGLEGKVGSSAWGDLHEEDKKAIFMSQAAKAETKAAKKKEVK